jgi:REP element-mobilizing transposase RayT
MAHTFTHLLAHIIFSTKNREPLLDADLKPRLFAYMGGIVRELGGAALLINGPTDHVHLLVSLPSTKSISDFMRVLKTNSSRWVHEQFPAKQTFAWQTGYGAFSVSESNRCAVEKYIANQEEHHRVTDFKDEFISFLKRHGMGYEEKYLWD